MFKWLKLSHYHHTGKVRPHEHTSYIPLGVMLVIVGACLTVYTTSAASPPPQSESIGLSGSVPAKAPVTAATITKPSNNQRFSTTPITVSGTCPKETVVEIFKNDIFAGSALCTDTGTYTLVIDLLIGKNTLVARIYDALNQSGPPSAPLVVFYDALPGQSSALTSLDFGGDQLLLNTDAVFRGIFPKQDMSMPVDILGGKPPYAINIQWGDSTNKMIPRSDNTEFRAVHAYQKPGIYQISLQGTDADGRVAFLTVAAIVNGQPEAIAPSSTTTPSNIGKLLLLWPVFIGIVAAVISFWLGEQREKHILAKRPTFTSAH